MKDISRPHWQLNNIEYGRYYVRKYGEQIDERFAIDQNNAQVVDSLIQYFQGDPGFQLPGGHPGDLTKVILMIGTPGTGKTLMSHSMRYSSLQIRSAAQ